jgi:V/A-type H+-transporting ATPase subunit I
MIFPQAMKQLVAVVLDRDADRVTRVLLDQGVMHFVGVTEVDPSLSQRLAAANPKVTEAMIAEIRRRIEGLFSLAGQRLPAQAELRVEDLQALDLKETNRRLDELATGLAGIRERQQALQQEILKLEDIRRQLSMFGDLTAGVQARSQFSFLNIQSGTVRRAALPALLEELKTVPSVHLVVGEEENQSTLLLITMRRDDGLVNKLLDKHGWTDVELARESLGGKEEVLADLDGKLSRFREEQDKLKSGIEGLIGEKRSELERIWSNLRLNELYARIQSYFSRTARTMIFSGWLPAHTQKPLGEALQRATAGRCYLEWHDPSEMSAAQKAAVPVQLTGPRLLAPFKMLVTNYSIPQYGTVDPTAFVFVAYLAMFGLMFGDVGHGLVLALLGLLGMFSYKGASQNIRNLMKLAVWCGGSAVVAGVLFGSYFGLSLLPPLWFNYHGAVAGEHTVGVVKDVYGILLITLWFGIGVIGLGLALNWVNRLRRGDWFGLIFDKAGLIGGWIYAAGVYTAFYFAGKSYKQLPPGNFLFLAIGLPLLLLGLKAPLEFFLHREHKRFQVFTLIDWAMEWVVEILEIFAGYLANTLSFMRVAGLGIAHVSLVVAFFSIAGMLGGPGGAFTPLSYLVLVAGNVLIIALEGLSAGIQSLRLNYYEFFSKYFSGSGKAYEPISLRKRPKEE